MNTRGDLVWVSKYREAFIICEPTPSNIWFRRRKGPQCFLYFASQVV